MNLKQYIDDLPRGGASALAEAIEVPPSFLSQMASGKASVNPTYAVKIEQVTNGRVTRKDLRPNDWHLIWPELKEGSDVNNILGGLDGKSGSGQRG